MKDKIIKIISEQLNIPAERITEDALIVQDLGADSLDLVELLMSFEDEFGVSISDDEAQNFKTVKDIFDAVDNFKA